jgi:hypothetical protein
MTVKEMLYEAGSVAPSGSILAWQGPEFKLQYHKKKTNYRDAK